MRKKDRLEAAVPAAVPAIIFIAFFSIAGCCHEEKNPSSSVNEKPAASFTIVPASGPVESDFVLDASGSRDTEDSPRTLRVRWDFENDGVWDTDWSTLKTVAHRYVTMGIKTIMLQVMDSGQLTDEAGRQISVYADSGTVADIDGNVYQTVRIGTQRWMAENLRVTHYCNGAALEPISDGTMWVSTGMGAYCSYANNEKWAAEYGRLYNLFAVADSRRLAPPGWHIPTDAEWQEMIDYLGGSMVAGAKMMEAGYRHWAIPNTMATNSSGFTALPGGGRDGSSGTFYGFNFRGLFWSVTPATGSSYWCRIVQNEHMEVTREACSLRNAFSVRCVMD